MEQLWTAAAAVVCSEVAHCQFKANVTFLYPLKASENQRFSDVFRGFRNDTLAWHGLICCTSQLTEATTGDVLWKKVFLKFFAKFTGKHLCWSLFFNRIADWSLFFNQVAGLRPATLLKKRLQHRCFLVNFAKFLRAPFLQNTSERLLLSFISGWD